MVGSSYASLHAHSISIYPPLNPKPIGYPPHGLQGMEDMDDELRQALLLSMQELGPWELTPY